MKIWYIYMIQNTSTSEWFTVDGKKKRDVYKKLSRLVPNKPKQKTRVDVCVQVGNGSFDTRA